MSRALQEVDLKDAKGEVKLAKKSDLNWVLKVPNFGEADYDGDSSAIRPAPRGQDHRRPRFAQRPRKDQSRVLGRRQTQAGRFRRRGRFRPGEVWALEAKAPATLRIEVLRKDGADAKEERSVLLIGKKADEKGEKYYARMDGETNVVRISAKPIDQLLAVVKDPNAIRSRDLVKLDEKKVDAIDIQNASGLVQLRKTGEPARWKLFNTPDKGQAAEQQSVDVLLRGLATKRQVSGFPEKDKTDKELGLDKPSGEVSLWVDGLKKDEKDKEKAVSPTRRSRPSS